MGQYYKPCLLTKSYKKGKRPIVGALNPYAYNNGAKLVEHSYVGNFFVRAATIMLQDNTTRPFVWCGDYADEINDGLNMFDFASQNKFDEKYSKNVIGTDMDVIEKVLDFYYIINHSKKQYVEVPPQGNFHPLPLLTADGNGRGSGDYSGTEMDKVGIWAYDIIQCGNEVPDGYTKLNVDFDNPKYTQWLKAN